MRIDSNKISSEFAIWIYVPKLTQYMICFFAVPMLAIKKRKQHFKLKDKEYVWWAYLRFLYRCLHCLYCHIQLNYINNRSFFAVHMLEIENNILSWRISNSMRSIFKISLLFSTYRIFTVISYKMLSLLFSISFCCSRK